MPQPTGAAGHLTPEARDRCFDTFITAVEAGERLRTACRLADIAWSSVCRWIADNPDYATRYQHARAANGALFEERAQDEADRATPETVQVARLRVDTAKWRAGVADPHHYGDRSTHPSVTLNIGTLHLDALRAPRASPAQDGYQRITATTSTTSHPDTETDTETVDET